MAVDIVLLDLSMPGMEVRSGGGVASAGGAVWDQLQADSSLNYPADFSWYVIMKPIGAALEKNTVDGWRAYVRELEPLLEKLGAKYILNESVLIFPLDSIRQLKLYCREIQIMIREMKAEMRFPAQRKAAAVRPPACGAAVRRRGPA